MDASVGPDGSEAVLLADALDVLDLLAVAVADDVEGRFTSPGCMAYSLRMFFSCSNRWNQLRSSCYIQHRQWRNRDDQNDMD